MTTTLLLTHPACSHHDPGPGHPENPGRMKAVLDVLGDAELAAVKRMEAPLASAQTLALAHDADHVEQVLNAIPGEGHRALDGDTVMNPHSGDAARAAAGAVVLAVDELVQGSCDNAFCAVRPPGHHAERSRAMGFCLFNSVAIGALHAIENHGLKRVAVLDFDVHHGNGTQDIFWNDPRVMYLSSHQMPLYPGTGAASETGVGNIVNAPLYPGSGSAAFRQAWSGLLLPAMRDFAPQLMIVSAGFDAHQADPLASLGLTTDDFAWLSRELIRTAGEVCEGRLVSALEGGYDPGALAACTRAHLMALMGG